MVLGLFLENLLCNLFLRLLVVLLYHRGECYTKQASVPQGGSERTTVAQTRPAFPKIPQIPTVTQAPGDKPSPPTRRVRAWGKALWGPRNVSLDYVTQVLGSTSTRARQPLLTSISRDTPDQIHAADTTADLSVIYLLDPAYWINGNCSTPHQTNECGTRPLYRRSTQHSPKYLGLRRHFPKKGKPKASADKPSPSEEG